MYSDQADAVNAALGPNAAQRTLLSVIRREFLDQRFKDGQRTLDWETLEAEGVARYGELAREAVYGAKMMHDLVRSDWVAFARAYAKYYATALGRSADVDHALAYQILKNVEDAEPLEAAIRVMEHPIEQDHEFKFGRYDPAELDTYANLLYKVGRTSEAIVRQKKAVVLADGRDQEIAEHFEKMKRGVPTWTVN